MNEPPFDVNRAHRWFAIEWNNRAWDLLEDSNRSAEATTELVLTAHASCLHWSKVGNAVNRVRALCLVANAHSAASLGDAAVYFAQACLEMLEGNRDDVADWDVAFAYDCLARAHGVTGDKGASRDYARRAAEAGAVIAEDGDRDVFQQWFATCPGRE